MLEQILDTKGTVLMTWQQLKCSRRKSKRGKVAAWYRELEEKVLENPLKREIKKEFRKGAENYLGAQDLLEEVTTDKRKQEWVVYEDSPNKKKRVGRIRKKNENSVLVEHWENKENEGKQEVISRCEGCSINKERRHRECKAWQPKKKVLGAISKNCLGKGMNTIDFSLETLTKAKEQQKEKREEWALVGLRALEERELEIIEAQNFSKEVSLFLKDKAQIFRASEEDEIVFYTDGSLGQREDNGNMGVGWLGISRIGNRIVSVGNLRVVNWLISTRAELIGVWLILLIVQYNIIVRVLIDSEQVIEDITRACNTKQYSK